MSDVASRPAAGWTVPAVVYLVSVAVYVLLGMSQEIPLISPDETTYGHLARSLADGEGFSWYGRDESWTTPLYIYLLAPSWLLASGESAYELAKVTGALVVSTVVFPVWLLAARLLPDWRAAAVPTVLTVAGTWMLSAAGLLTENLALPLSTAALVCAVLAIRDPDSRWRWGALGFALLATFSRAQLGVLFAIMLAALLLDCLFAEDRRARLERHRNALIALGLIVAAGIILVLSGSSALGTNAGVSEFSPSLSEFLSKTGLQWIALAVMSGIVPLAALLVLAARPSAWRDRDLGPLLCVTAASVLLLLVETGYYNAGFPLLEWSIERYVEYAVPLLLVLLFVALDRRALPARWLGLAGSAVALTLLASSDIRRALEQRATNATAKLVDGVLGLSIGPALALAALLIAALAALLVARLDRTRAIYAVGGLLLAALVVQGQWVWRWQLDVARQIRAEYPADLSWVDSNAKGPVTRLYFIQNSYLFPRADVFNERIEQVLIPPNRGASSRPHGATCTWSVDNRGSLVVDDSCKPLRRVVWNDDTTSEMTFHGGRSLARDPSLGQLIAVPANPRLRSVIRMPCPRVGLGAGKDDTPVEAPSNLPCPPAMSVFLWLDAPATLELTFQGGTRDQSVTAGSRVWTLPAHRRTTVRIPVTSANANIQLATAWDRTVGTQLVDAALVGDDERTPLL